MYAMLQLPMFTEHRKIHIVVIATKNKQSCNVTKLLWKGLSTMYVTFHGIYSFPRDSFIVDISMHFWATVDVV